MPFCPSEVLPRELSRKKTQELQDDAQFDDFNQVTAFTIVQAIRQLASLTEQASNVFDSTLRNIQDFVRRTSALEPRLLEIENEVSRLNKKRTKVGRSSLKKQISVNGPWRHDERLPTNLFLSQDRPIPVSRFRELHCDPILLHFARYKIYLKEHLSSGSLNGSFESLTSQGSSISLPKYTKNPKPKRATSLNRFSFRRKNQSQESIRISTLHDQSPDLTGGNIPRPQSCDPLNADDDSDTPSTPNDSRSRDRLDSSYPPGVHTKEADYVPVRFHSFSEPLSASNKKSNSTLSSHDDSGDSQQNLQQPPPPHTHNSRPCSFLDPSLARQSSLGATSPLVASSTSCLPQAPSIISTPDEQTNGASATGVDAANSGGGGGGSFSRSKKSPRPVSLFEGQEKKDGIKSLQPNIHNSGLDKSSDCVDSVLDNLPSVAEDEEFDLNEDVSDAMKCLDDVIEADETEESDEPVRGAVDTDDDSASNEIPSVECEYGAGRDAEIDGSKGHLRKSLDLLPSRWDPKRLLGGGAADEKIGRNSSFVVRSKKWATKKLMSGTSNSNTSTPCESPNLSCISKNGVNGTGLETSLSTVNENGTLTSVPGSGDNTQLDGLVSASPNPGDPTLKNNDVTPKMAQADDGWPDAFYNTNNNNDSNHSTGSVPTDADVVIKNEDDVTEPRDNASDVTSQQSVSLGSSTPKEPDSNLADCLSAGDDTMGSNSTLVEEEIRSGLEEQLKRSLNESPTTILPHHSQQPQSSSMPAASWNFASSPEDRDSVSSSSNNTTSEEMHSDPVLALRNKHNQSSLHMSAAPPLFPQLSDPGHYINHDRAAVGLNNGNMFAPAPHHHHHPTLGFHPSYANHGGVNIAMSNHHGPPQYPNPYPQSHMPDNQMVRFGFPSHQNYPASTFHEQISVNENTTGSKKNSVSSFLGNSSGKSKSKKSSRKVTWTDILWKPKSSKDASGVRQQPFANLNPNSDKGTKVKGKGGASGAAAGLSLFRRKSKRDPVEPNQPSDQSSNDNLEYLTPVQAAMPPDVSPLGTKFDPAKKTSYMNLGPGKQHLVPVPETSVPAQEIESNYNTSLYAESVSSSDQGSISPRGNNYANTAATLPGSEYYNGCPERLTSMMPKGELDNDIYLNDVSTVSVDATEGTAKNSTDVSCVDEEKPMKSATYVNGEHINQPGLTYENSYQKQQEAKMVALAENSKDASQSLITQLSSEEFVRKQLEEREMAESGESKDVTDSGHETLLNGSENLKSTLAEVHSASQDNQNLTSQNAESGSNDVKPPKTIHIDPFLFEQNNRPENASSDSTTKPVKKKNRIHFSDVIRRHSADVSSDEENLQVEVMEQKRVAKETKLRNMISESLQKKPERSILRRSPSSRNPDRTVFDFYSRDSSTEFDSGQNPRMSYTDSIDSSDSSTSNTNIPFIDDDKGSQANIYAGHHHFPGDSFNIDPALLAEYQEGIGRATRATLDDDMDLIDDSGSETDEDDEDDDDDDDDDELDEDDENDSVVYHSSAAALQMLEIDRIA